MLRPAIPADAAFGAGDRPATYRRPGRLGRPDDCPECRRPPLCDAGPAPHRNRGAAGSPPPSPISIGVACAGTLRHGPGLKGPDISRSTVATRSLGQQPPTDRVRYKVHGTRFPRPAIQATRLCAYKADTDAPARQCELADPDRSAKRKPASNRSSASSASRARYGPSRLPPRILMTSVGRQLQSVGWLRSTNSCL